MRGRIIVALAAAGLAWAAISTDAEAFAPGSITVGGQDISIAANGYVGNGNGDEGFAYRAQAVIDTGAIASAVTPLNVSDGANTHLMAHNPGTFSAIANTIHEGAKYVITDFNGVSKVYEFHFVAEIQAYTPVTGALDSAIWGQNGETITLQYCAYGTGTPQIWIGYPSEDQSLLSVTPTAEVTLPQTEESDSVAKTEEEATQADANAEAQDTEEVDSTEAQEEPVFNLDAMEPVATPTTEPVVPLTEEIAAAQTEPAPLELEEDTEEDKPSNVNRLAIVGGVVASVFIIVWMVVQYLM